MKNFIIFNSEKEGSCALIKALDNFEDINIISDFIEPFDKYMFVNSRYALGKDMSKEDFLKCLSIIYDSSKNYLEELNSIYAKYNNGCQFKFSKDKSHGFKMRIRKQWKTEIFSFLERFHVTAFVLIRQDVLRWALSKYHGDGTGRKGHLQFDHVDIQEVPKIRVGWRSLKKTIERCKRRIEDKKKLIQDLRSSGVEAFPLYYEDFCNNKLDYFKNLLAGLDIKMTDTDLQQVMSMDCHYKKVHPDDIQEFVENHEEIIKKFEAFTSQEKIPNHHFIFNIPNIFRR